MQINLATQTGSTFNIVALLEKDFDDIGYYSPTDGDILQEKNKCNFTYTKSGYVVYVTNTVDKDSFVELRDVVYTINWGDGSTDSSVIGETVHHIYTITGETTITLSMESPWVESIKKTIIIGGDAIINNPLGTLTINIPYSDATFEQNFISLEDAVCQDIDETNDLVSGFTQSLLHTLIKYGQTTVQEGLDGQGNGVLPSGLTESYTAYTINDMFYVDLPDGLTYFHINVQYDPLTLICQLLTKDDALMGVVNDIEIQSDVYVERGTVSVFESNLRLTEVSSVGEISIYGNKYFNVKKTP
jgi:hypothetical protein